MKTTYNKKESKHHHKRKSSGHPGGAAAAVPDFGHWRYRNGAGGGQGHLGGAGARIRQEPIVGSVQSVADRDPEARLGRSSSHRDRKADGRNELGELLARITQKQGVAKKHPRHFSPPTKRARSSQGQHGHDRRTREVRVRKPAKHYHQKSSSSSDDRDDIVDEIRSGGASCSISESRRSSQRQLAGGSGYGTKRARQAARCDSSPPPPSKPKPLNPGHVQASSHRPVPPQPPAAAAAGLSARPVAPRPAGQRTPNRSGAAGSSKPPTQGWSSDEDEAPKGEPFSVDPPIVECAKTLTVGLVPELFGVPMNCVYVSLLEDFDRKIQKNVRRPAAEKAAAALVAPTDKKESDNHQPTDRGVALDGDLSSHQDHHQPQGVEAAVTPTRGVRSMDSSFPSTYESGVTQVTDPGPPHSQNCHNCRMARNSTGAAVTDAPRHSSSHLKRPTVSSTDRQDPLYQIPLPKVDPHRLQSLPPPRSPEQRADTAHEFGAGLFAHARPDNFERDGPGKKPPMRYRAHAPRGPPVEYGPASSAYFCQAGPSGMQSHVQRDSRPTDSSGRKESKFQAPFLPPFLGMDYAVGVSNMVPDDRPRKNKRLPPNGKKSKQQMATMDLLDPQPSSPSLENRMTDFPWFNNRSPHSDVESSPPGFG